MDRNQLRGSLGDELNVIFAAAGFNIRKLIRAFALFLYRFFKLVLIQLAYQLNQSGSKRFGKGRAREGKNLSSKGFFFSHSYFFFLTYLPIRLIPYSEAGIKKRNPVIKTGFRLN